MDKNKKINTMEEDLDIRVITKRTVNGIVALISRQFILLLVNFGAKFVVSSYLAISGFGIYTVVTAIQRVISFFTDFGLGAALVQKKGTLEDEDTTTTFTIQFLITLFIFGIVFLTRNIIASTFKLDNAAITLLLTLVFCIFLSSFKIIPSILLERFIMFDKLIIPQIAEQLSFNIILVVLLLKNFGLTSYTYAFLISSLLSIPIYYYISPWKIKFGISRQALTHLKYGTQYQAKNILATLKDDFLTLFLARLLTFTQIGFIGFAQQWSFMVYRFIVDSVTKVTFSTYARMQESKEYLRKAIEKSLFYVSLIMFPALTGIILIFPYFIAYIPKWHNKWEPAIISFIFFCLNAAVSSLSNILVNVLDANYKIKTTLRLMVIWTALTWILTPIFVYLFGYNGVAASSFLVTLTIAYTIHLVHKVTPFSFIGSIYKPFIAAVIMGIFVFGFSRLFVTNIIILIFVILLGIALYLFNMYLLAREELDQGIKVVLRRHE
jgi:O-antigen/teichoic acid export membrane protein